MTVAIRIGLAVLFIEMTVVGLWNTAWPEAFYANFPTVDLTPPFSEHYARDFGATTLGIAMLLGVALVRPKAHYAIPAAAAYSIFAVPHFFFHLFHMQNATTGQAIFLTTANAIVAIIGLGIIALTVARERRTATRRA